MEPVRVLHVFGALDRGGAELRTLDQMRSLAKQGVVADFISLSGRAGDLEHVPQEWGGDVTPMALDVRWPARFFRFLRLRGYDVVHSHVATFSGGILLIAAAAGVPVRIAHFRSDGDAHGDDWRRRVQRGLMRLLIRRSATHILGVTPGALSGGFSPEWEKDPRAAVVANGLTSSDRPGTGGPPGGTLHVMNVGRPLPTKRRAYLADISDAIIFAGARVRLSVVGAEGADTDFLREWSKTLSGGSELAVYGVRDDVRELLSMADVLVFPSEREGLPGVVLEALFEGTPVVAVDLPGARFIQANVPGAPLRLLAPGANAGEWAQAVMETCAQPADRGRVRSLMEGSIFSLSRSAGALAEIYGVTGSGQQ